MRVITWQELVDYFKVVDGELYYSITGFDIPVPKTKYVKLADAKVPYDRAIYMLENAVTIIN